MIDSLFSSFAPHSCCGCQNIGSLLCHQCKYDIISESYALCIGCQVPTWGDNLCEKCRHAWGIESAWCVGVREGSLQALIDRYKFDSARQAAAICVELLDARLPLLPSDVAVVPVPTVPTHVRTRGFDHAALMARRFAKARGLRYAAPLRRTGDGTQHFKSRTERLQTAAAGLEAKKAVPERVLLVDDICTTGATLRACAHTLRGVGTQEVYVAIIARQPLD
jgi:ComF family protein